MYAVVVETYDPPRREWEAGAVIGPFDADAQANA